MEPHAAGSQEEPKGIAFQTLSPIEAWDVLQTSEKGLAPAQVLDRRERYGPNDISRAHRRPAIMP